MSTPFKNYNLVSIDEFIKVYKLDENSHKECMKLTGKGKTRPAPKEGNDHADK